MDKLFTDQDFNLSRKEIFLNNHKTPSGFKRYNGSPLRYGGGKSLAVAPIISYLPDNLERVISPFIGGGSVEVAISKELNIPVLGFDIFDLLVNYWKHQCSNPIELYNEILKHPNTKNQYEEVKNKLKSVWNYKTGLNNNVFSNLELAVYYYISHNLSYGPGFLGWMSSIYLDDKKYNSLICKVKNFNNPYLEVNENSFENVIPNYNNDFLYLDPPYFLDGDSKMFKGIYPMRNFPIHHNNFNHELLNTLLKSHKGGFILSYNDCSWIRENYKDFEIVEINWNYTMGQGEKRIGKNRLERNYDNGNTKTSHEVLILGHKSQNYANFRSS